jgi:hypothetical protein
MPSNQFETRMKNSGTTIIICFKFLKASINSRCWTTRTTAFADFHPLLRSLPDFLLPHQRSGQGIAQGRNEAVRQSVTRSREWYQVGHFDRLCLSWHGPTVEHRKFYRHQAAYIAGSFLEAGSDTITSTLCGFVNYVTLSLSGGRKRK